VILTFFFLLINWFFFQFYPSMLYIQSFFLSSLLKNYHGLMHELCVGKHTHVHLGHFFPFYFWISLCRRSRLDWNIYSLIFSFKKMFFFPIMHDHSFFFLILCIWCCYLRKTDSIQSSFTIFLAFLKHNCSLLTFFLMLIFIFLAHGIAGDAAISYSKRCLVIINKRFSWHLKKHIYLNGTQFVWASLKSYRGEMRAVKKKIQTLGAMFFLNPF
jgi:hypothetical protein